MDEKFERELIQRKLISLHTDYTRLGYPKRDTEKYKEKINLHDRMQVFYNRLKELQPQNLKEIILI